MAVNPYEVQLDHTVPPVNTVADDRQAYRDLAYMNAEALWGTDDGLGTYRANVKYKGFLDNLASFGEEQSKAIARGFISSAGDIGTLAYNFGKSLSIEDNGELTERQKNWNKQAKYMMDAGETLRKFSKFAVEDESLKPDSDIFAGEFTENPSLTRLVASGMSIVPSIMSMYSLRALTGSTKAAYLLFNGMDTADILKETEDGKISEWKRYLAWGTSTALNILADVATDPLETIFGDKFVKNVTNKWAKIAIGAGVEGLNEGVQEFQQNAVKRVAYNKKQALMQGVFEAFLGGAIAGGAGKAAYVNRLTKLYQEEADRRNAIESDTDGVAINKREWTAEDIAVEANEMLRATQYQTDEMLIIELMGRLSKLDQDIIKLEGTEEGQKLIQTRRELDDVARIIGEQYTAEGQEHNLTAEEIQYSAQVVQGMALKLAELTGKSPLAVMRDTWGGFAYTADKDGVLHFDADKSGRVDFAEPVDDTLAETPKPDMKRAVADLVKTAKRRGKQTDGQMQYQADGQTKVYDPRGSIPKVRGGWSKDKIIKYLKGYSSLGGTFNAAKLISEFDSVEELKEHMFYHGSKGGAERLKPSITMSDREIERVGGGGYGEKYWAISISKSKKIASRFSGDSRYVNIYPVILAKNAKVVEMPELSDSAELDAHIVDLYEKGVDAVWIGDKNGGEQELAVINPRAIANIGRSDTYKVFQLGTGNNPIRIASDEDIARMLEISKEYVDRINNGGDRTYSDMEDFRNTARKGIFFQDTNDGAYQTVQYQADGQTKAYSNNQLRKILADRENNRDIITDLYNNYEFWNMYPDNIVQDIKLSARMLGLEKRNIPLSKSEISESIKAEMEALKLPKKITTETLAKMLDNGNTGWIIKRSEIANTGSEYITLENVNAPDADNIVVSFRDHYQHSNDFVRPDFNIMTDVPNNWQTEFVRLADTIGLKNSMVTKARKYIELGNNLKNVWTPNTYQTVQYQEYTANTIDIDGVARPVTDSTGRRIATTEDGLRNFYKWFGDSKAVDKDGRPLVVYHGTDVKFDTFEYGDIGFHFGTEQAANERLKDGGEIMPAFISLKNPLVLEHDPYQFDETGELPGMLEDLGLFPDDVLTRDEMVDLEEQEDYEPGENPYIDMVNYRKALAKKGYDGIIYTNEYEDKGSTSYVVFNPNQIKSATANNGSFSTESNNIYYQDADNLQKTNGSSARGMAYTMDGKTYIKLFSNANASTFVHEAAHWFFNELNAIKDLSAETREMYDKATAWMEATAKKRYNVTDRDGRIIVTDKKGRAVYDMNGNGFASPEMAWLYAENEMFARGFEQYLKEGKAPSTTLGKVFQSFKQWLGRIYGTAKNVLGIEINDSIKDVYAKMLGGETLDYYMAESDADVLKQIHDLQIKQHNEELKRAFESQITAPYVPESTAKAIRKAGASGWQYWMKGVDERARDIDERFRNRLNRYEMRMARNLNGYLDRAKPFFDLWQKMTDDDRERLDLALKNQSGIFDDNAENPAVALRDEILAKYEGGREAYDNVVSLIAYIRDKGINAGMEIGQLQDYFPRHVKLYDDMMAYFNGDPELKSEIDRVLRQAENKKREIYERAENKDGKSPDLTDDERADIIDEWIRKQSRPTTSKINPGNIKQRKINVVDRQLNQYYDDSASALLRYITGMNRAISNREIWGYDKAGESIGDILGLLVKEGVIDKGELDEAKEILNARLNQKGVNNVLLRGLRDLSYMYTMGGFNTALRQLDDTGVAIWKAGFGNAAKVFVPVFKDTIKSIRDKITGGESESDIITKKELGIDTIDADISSALSNDALTGKMLNKLFDLNGVSIIDGFGKNLLSNALFEKYKDMANKDADGMRKKLAYLEGDLDQTIKDFKDGKRTESTLLVIFNDMADVQPISLSQMPQGYLENGNGRILYMLKTFMVKRLNTVAREGTGKIYEGWKAGDKGMMADGLRNLTTLTMMCILAGGTADWLIDLLYGRQFKVSDSVTDNILNMYMMNRYTTYKAKEEGANAFIMGMLPLAILSPESDLGVDIYKTIAGKRDVKDWETWKGIPILGRFYYWWFGRGEEKKKKEAKRK